MKGFRLRIAKNLIKLLFSHPRIFFIVHVKYVPVSSLLTLFLSFIFQDGGHLKL